MAWCFHCGKRVTRYPTDDGHTMILDVDRAPDGRVVIDPKPKVGYTIHMARALEDTEPTPPEGAYRVHDCERPE